MYTVKGRGVLSCSPVSIPRISLEGNNGLLNDMSVIFFWRNGFCNVVIICDISHFANVLHQNRRKQVMSRFYKINTTGVTCGAGTAHHSGAPEFTHGFQSCSCYSIFNFMCMFCRSLFVFFSFVHCVVCSSSIYGFWLSLWYLQALLIIDMKEKELLGNNYMR